MYDKKIFKKYKMYGFTLIELLIVIAVMAILTTVVFVALNPLGRFQDARNSTRWSDVNAVLAALKLDQVDNGGTYVSVVADDLTDGLYYQIGTGESCNVTCANPTVVLQADCVDLSDLVDEGYLPEIPVDPFTSTASEDHTFYYLVKFDTGSIEVGSCGEESGSGSSIPQISVKR